MYHAPEIGQMPDAVSSELLQPWTKVSPAEFDINKYPADEVQLYVNVNRTQLKLTGLLIKLLLDFKDNYAGVADHYSDIYDFERQVG